MREIRSTCVSQGDIGLSIYTYTVLETSLSFYGCLLVLSQVSLSHHRIMTVGLRALLTILLIVKVKSNLSTIKTSINWLKKLLQIPEMLAIIGFQEFSAPLWGSGGLGFKSQHSDSGTGLLKRAESLKYFWVKFLRFCCSIIINPCW